MQDVKEGVDEKMRGAELSLFKGSAAVRSSDVPVEEDDSDYDDDDYDGNPYNQDDNDAGEEEDDDDEDDDNLDNDDNEEEDEEEEDDDEEEDEEEDDEEEEDDSDNDDDNNYDDNYDDNDSNDDVEGDKKEDDNRAEWKQGMRARAEEQFRERVQGVRRADTMKSVYGSDWASGSGMATEDLADGRGGDDESFGDELFVVKGKEADRRRAAYRDDNSIDSSRAAAFTSDVPMDASKAYSDVKSGGGKAALKDYFKSLRRRFVTGGYSQDGEGSGNDLGDGVYHDDGSDEEGDAGSEYGDFEDVQTGEVFGASGEKKSASQGDSKKRAGDDDEYEFMNDDEEEEEEEEYDSDAVEAANEDIDRQLRDENAKKKASAKKGFDDEYDAEGKDVSTHTTAAYTINYKATYSHIRYYCISPIQATGGENPEDEEKFLEVVKRRQEDQRERNRLEFGEEGGFARLQYEGFRQGLYVRVLVRGVDSAFVKGFNPTLPVVMGGLLNHESTFGEDSYVLCHIVVVFAISNPVFQA